MTLKRIMLAAIPVVLVGAAATLGGRSGPRSYARYRVLDSSAALATPITL